ncbi:MAG: uroporphyrinogen decarboxylase family protein [Bryobacteraceae bacterium]
MTLTRRNLLLAAAAAPLFGKASFTSRERVTRALKGGDVDRPPLSLWHHFGLEKDGPRKHAEATLAFHRNYGADLVKVMSDFPYPKPSSAWWDLREEKNPFAPQLEALREIHRGLNGRTPFVETIFNPWNVAEKLSSKEEVQRLKNEKPQQLLDALAVIARSEANHARLAIQTGASGIFLAIANADSAVLSKVDYEKFSAPFDRIVLDAVRSARLNILHIHGAKPYLDLFVNRWPAAVINYSVAATGVRLADVRAKYAGVLMGGVDETAYRTLTVDQLRAQYESARKEAGPRYFLSPGCSVPNEATPGELARLKSLFA